MWPDLPKPYWYLVALRIILVFIPQPGYIHPDEYFQSVEILAGDVFGVQSSPPWEFNSSFPIRSMTIPYFTTGTAYRLLGILDRLFKGVVTPYALLVAPRVLVCAVSFAVDFSFCKICSDNNEKYKTRLVLLASSYVMLVYGTRTFTNTTELVLFALLLRYVAESVVFSNTLLKKKEYLNYRYETSRTTVEKVKFHKLRTYLTSDSLRSCFQIGTVSVLGFFNRPTFAGYALIPVFFWLYRGIGSKLVAPLKFHLRLVAFVLCCAPALLFCVLVDSFYYGHLTWGELGVFDVSIDNFVFTPWNFVKYNVDSGNLAKHGLHPRFLHVLVNVPLLFNVLGVCGIFGFLQHAQNFLKGRHHLLPTVRSIKGLMTLSILAPVALLSIFPHQEPRFLVPIIVPLVYLYGHSVLPEIDRAVARPQNGPQPPPPSKKAPSNAPANLWLLINALLVVFYGFVHQGGVYQATVYLSQEMRSKPAAVEYHVVTSHVYSMPESFLLQKAPGKLYFAENDKKYAVNRRAFLHEEGSLDLGRLVEKVRGILDDNQKRKKSRPNRKFKVYLVIPSSLEDRLSYFKTGRGLEFQEVATFYPHLSVEAFPDLVPDLSYVANNFEFNVLWYYLVGSFGLELYEVKDAGLKVHDLGVLT